MSNGLNERDMEALAAVLHTGDAGTETECEHSGGFAPCEHDARAVLTSDWYAGRNAHGVVDGYFVADDAHDETCVWRENDAHPVAVLGQRDLRDDPDLWDAIVALVEGAS